METNTKPSYNILLIDDDQFLLDMYLLKFTNRGHNITTARDGSGGLDKIREGLTPDFILLDLIMPVMNGLEFLEEFRKQNFSPKSLVVMLTNQGQTSDIEEAEKYNIKGYIIKAVTIPSEVVSEVERIAKENGI
jgi:CheY-like chemotaxis protein